MPAAIIEGDGRHRRVVEETAANEADVASQLAKNVTFTVMKVDSRLAGIRLEPVRREERPDLRFDLRPAGADGKTLEHGFPEPAFRQRLFVGYFECGADTSVKGRIEARDLGASGSAATGEKEQEDEGLAWVAHDREPFLGWFDPGRARKFRTGMVSGFRRTASRAARNPTPSPDVFSTR